MRIVIDLQACQSESRFRGIGRYSMSLAKAMATQCSAHDLWILLSNSFPDTIEFLRKEFDGLIAQERIITFSLPGSTAEMHHQNRWRARIGELLREKLLLDIKPDLVFNSSLFEGWVDDAVVSVNNLDMAEYYTAVTLYDLIPLVKSEVYLSTPDIRDYYSRKIESIKQANILLSISNYSRTEAITQLGIGADRVVNIASAIEPKFRSFHISFEKKQKLFNQYGIRESFLLYSPGGFDERKNIYRLIDAFARLPLGLRQIFQLVITSRISDGDRTNINQYCRRQGLSSNSVLLTGYLSDEELIDLYNLCDLFVFPSLYEGFGLPILEAMSCGAPVIASNSTSIPEVVGLDDALFDPESTESIQAKIYQALVDLNFRQHLKDNALKQSSLFSWENSARVALESFEELYSHSLSAQSKKIMVASSPQSYSSLINGIAKLVPDLAASRERNLVKIAEAIYFNEKVSSRVTRTCNLEKNINWRVEGPFDSTYSLALLNREFSRALERLGHQVILHSTEGPGDFSPSAKFLQSNPDLAEMNKRVNQVPISSIDVISRNLYPPRVHDAIGRINILHTYNWEESGFPVEWIDQFNEYLQGILCASRHVEKILQDHGLVIPTAVSGNGVDHWDYVEPDPHFSIQGKGFRFLHVSSCFPRKGVDILLEAYGRAFTANDDVSLVIKTFPNPHNDIHQQIQSFKKKYNNYPDIILIEDDLCQQRLKALYTQCDFLVAPSRAEGFGLPLAESMLSGMGVITTNWGGQTDFCTSETAWLVDFEYVRAKSHFHLFDSVWAEPDVQHLSNLMNEVRSLPRSFRQEKSDRGKELLRKRYSWKEVASESVAVVRQWAKMPFQPQPKIGWITTYNTRCGIATYSALLLQYMPETIKVLAAKNSVLTCPDQENVTRCWKTDDKSLSELSETIDQYRLDTIVIQFNYGFFDFSVFSLFLNQQKLKGRSIVLIMHATIDPPNRVDKKLQDLAQGLNVCDRILVHTPADMNRLKEIGVIKNVSLFPHGVNNFTSSQAARNFSASNRFVLTSYGFFLPHKGLTELVEALALLRDRGIDVVLRMINAEYPIPESSALISETKKLINKLEVQRFVDLKVDFLPDYDCLHLLSQSDLIVFPYQATAESSSAAVRYGLASGKPVAVTPIPIFEDVSPAVWFLPGTTPLLIANGVEKIIHELGSQDAQQKYEKAKQWVESHRYSKLSRRLFGMLRAIHYKKVLDPKN